MEKSSSRQSVLTVARVGAVLVDLESGLTLGACTPQPRPERRDVESEELTDLPSLAHGRKAKLVRDK
jgi:hypothetical protein